MVMRIFIAVLCIVGAGATGAAPLDGAATYDKLFRNGTLDTIERDAELIYDRKVTNALKPQASVRDTGTIAITFSDEDPDMALLEFRKDGKFRRLGLFPATVGNPMIMFFYESVVRDMAEAAGGSPFYIRNRVKESLVQPSEVQVGEMMVDGRMVPTETILLYPFKDDPNLARMQGFGDLELRVTMSEAVPGWYMSLVAEASGGDVYRSELTFDKLEETP